MNLKRSEYNMLSCFQILVTMMVRKYVELTNDEGYSSSPCMSALNIIHCEYRTILQL